MSSSIRKYSDTRHTGDPGLREHDVEEGHMPHTAETSRTLRGQGEGLSDMADQPAVRQVHEDSTNIFDFSSKQLAEIYKNVMNAIDEHKNRITEEYKNMKRELDVEQGNIRSQLKLAKKERRSEKTIEQRQKTEHSSRKAHMIKLHEVLMRHHFSLSHVEEECVQALKEAWLNYAQTANKTELVLWKRTCQDFHETLEMPVKGFTVQKKWKRIREIINELSHILSDGIAALTRLYTKCGVQPELYLDKERTWKPVYYLRETKEKLLNQEKLKKKALVIQWSALGEELKESLGKHTLLVRYEHRRRLEAMDSHCVSELNAVQERSSRRHGKLMQKIAKEQQLLDRERTEIKMRHKKFSKKRSEVGNDEQTDERPPLRMSGGLGATMGGQYGGMGSFGGMGGGGRNYNMSNAIDTEIANTAQDISGSVNETTPKKNDVDESSKTSALIYNNMTLHDNCEGQDNHSSTPEFADQSKLRAYLSRSYVARISPEDKEDAMERYFVSQKEAWLTNSFDFHHHAFKDSAPSVKVNDVEIKMPSAINRNLNAAKSSSSGSSQEESTSKDKKSTGKRGSSMTKKGKGKDSKSSTKPPSKPASKVSGLGKLFGFGKKAPSTPSTTGSGSEGSSSSGEGSSSDEGSDTGSPSSEQGSSATDRERSKSKGTAEEQPQHAADAGDIEYTEYKEFEPNEYKDKWSLKQLCKCCNMDTIVSRVCPCLKERYEDFKEKREEKRHKKAMRKDVLLRLRDEASRSRNV